MPPLNPQGKITGGVWNIPDPAGLGTQPCHLGNKHSLSGTQLLHRHQRLALKHSPQQPSGPCPPQRRALSPALPLQTLTAILLIRLVLAVFVPVAFPVQVDAFTIAALELMSRAGVEGLRIVATLLYGLVRLILTVRLVITDPQLWDAHAVVALELIGVAGQRGAFSFIAAIPAVIVTVTHEDDGDT